MSQIYYGYADYAVIYDTKKESFSLLYNNIPFLKGVKCSCDNEYISLKKDEKVDKSILKVKNKNVNFKFVLSDRGITLTYSTGLDVKICGVFSFGKNSVAINTRTEKEHLHTACGTFVFTEDNGIFDVDKDRLIYFKSDADVKILLDEKKEKYLFLMNGAGNVSFECVNDVYADKYNISYSPINKSSTFSKPPVGWMTWYAVKFDASEKVVLENAKWQSEFLKKYGANTIWIDWEWYHDTLTGIRDDGVNALSPDKVRYPNGMKYVADKIRELGLIPSLWIGFTNDPSMPDYVKDNPEIIITDEIDWCGKYFYDFTHPKYLNEFLPLAVKQVKEWGYEAIKFDTLPAAIKVQDKYRLKAYNPKLTAKESYRAVIKKVRELFGKDIYMLSCAALRDADVLWAADIFDAARVGNDIFKWSEFIKEGVSKTLRYYPMHNKVFYCDPDNVILREEFNTFHQAESRIYFTAMLGLPMTFGDVFSELGEERVSLIKKCLPVMDIKAHNLNRFPFNNEYLSVNLGLAVDYDDYNVVGMFNFKEIDATYKLDLASVVNDSSKRYHVYDFTHNKYIGIFKGVGNLDFDFEEHECRILSIREAKDIPQLISTTRHFSQGAEEVTEFTVRENKIEISCKPIEGESYDVILYIPEGYKVDEKLKALGDNLYKFNCEEEKYSFIIK